MYLDLLILLHVLMRNKTLPSSSQALRQTLLENLYYCYLVRQLYDRCDGGV